MPVVVAVERLVHRSLCPKGSTPRHRPVLMHCCGAHSTQISAGMEKNAGTALAHVICVGYYKQKYVCIHKLPCYTHLNLHIVFKNLKPAPLYRYCVRYMGGAG